MSSIFACFVQNSYWQYSVIKLFISVTFTTVFLKDSSNVIDANNFDENPATRYELCTLVTGTVRFSGDLHYIFLYNV